MTCCLCHEGGTCADRGLWVETGCRPSEGDSGKPISQDSVPPEMMNWVEFKNGIQVCSARVAGSGVSGTAEQQGLQSSGLPGQKPVVKFENRGCPVRGVLPCGGRQTEGAQRGEVLLERGGGHSALVVQARVTFPLSPAQGLLPGHTQLIPQRQVYTKTELHLYVNSPSNSILFELNYQLLVTNKTGLSYRVGFLKR